MKKKYLLFIILTLIITIPGSVTHASDIGINAGVLLPAAKFENHADTGFSLGTDIKLDVYDTLYYGLALNYGYADGNNGVDFWQVDLYPFIDWIFFRNDHVDIFARGGIGLSHYESDGIWWLDSQGNGVVTTFGIGCKAAENIELSAIFTKLYADFDVDYFLIRLGYNFDIDIKD